MTTTAYIGRFAPSPTGPLHFGSLVAAVASYCDAKANNGDWLVRMEDLDKPREVTGAAKGILTTLSAYGFEWDGEVVYQSRRNQYYESLLQQLKASGIAYPCTCSRKEIRHTQPLQGIEGAIYPKTCLSKAIKESSPKAWRVKVSDQIMRFEDGVQGVIEQNISEAIGDFIVMRADQLFAYQLAVVTDDAQQGVTHVVRGADLLHSTPRQIYLQQLLGLTTAKYAHIPLIVNDNGEKLSKQTLATAIDVSEKSQLLVKALDYLNQSPPNSLAHESVHKILQWGVDHWQLNDLPSTNITLK